MNDKNNKFLDTFPNPSPTREFLIHMEIPEFTCLCPLTGQPDFAHFALDYVPNQVCLELKSLKLYMWSFRDKKAFHEAVTNSILNEMVETLNPHFIRLTGAFFVRGGIYTTIVAEHRNKEWTVNDNLINSIKNRQNINNRTND